MLEINIYILLFFLGASLVLYVILGGADFGAGILEFFTKKEHKSEVRNCINQAMGPVWEANHMWLIIIIVILFMGFPSIFQIVMTSLHIPFVALLFGIVIRGSAFSFRHYDAKKDPKSQKLYSFAFSLSSLWSSFWLGIIAASLFRGKIISEPTAVYESYIAPWWGLYPSIVGLFTVLIFTYLSAVYLVGETSSVELKKVFLKKAYTTNIGLILVGGLVLLSSYYEGQNLVGDFFTSPLSIGSMIFASIFYVLNWFIIKKRKSLIMRTVAGAQVGFILFGWFTIYWPNALLTKDTYISFFDSAAPLPVLKQLVFALLIGSLFIFPGLFYLLKIFKTGKVD